MYFGIGKLTEESGELSEALGAWVLQRQMGRINQLLGKAIAFPVGEHWDGKGTIHDRLKDELADARAILVYFCNMNFSPEEQVEMGKRIDEKIALFIKWGLTGIPDVPVNAEPGQRGPKPNQKNQEMGGIGANDE